MAKRKNRTSNKVNNVAKEQNKKPLNETAEEALPEEKTEEVKTEKKRVVVNRTKVIAGMKERAAKPEPAAAEEKTPDVAKPETPEPEAEKQKQSNEPAPEPEAVEEKTAETGSTEEETSEPAAEEISAQEPAAEEEETASPESAVEETVAPEPAAVEDETVSTEPAVEEAAAPEPAAEEDDKASEPAAEEKPAAGEKPKKEKKTPKIKFKISDDIKKEDKKHIGKFIIFAALCFVIGGICGFCGAAIRDKVTDANINVWRVIGDVQLAAVPVFQYIFLIFVPVYLIICYMLYDKCRKEMSAINKDSEEDLEKFEGRISVAIIVSALGNSLATLLYGIALYCLPITLEETGTSATVRVLMVIVFIFCITAGNVYFVNKLVNIEKEINPEKAGSTFDLKFQKKWFDSCDEAEKLFIYKACYKVFTKMTTIYGVVLSILLVLGTLFEIGVLPFVAVALLLITQQAIYFYEVHKLEKSKNSEPFVELF